MGKARATVSVHVVTPEPALGAAEAFFAFPQLSTVVSLSAGLLAVRPGWSEGLKVLQLDRAGWDEPCGSWGVVEVVLYMEVCVSHSLCWRKQKQLLGWCQPVLGHCWCCIVC